MLEENDRHLNLDDHEETTLEFPLTQSEAIASLAAATSELARAISKISYTPTQWVDNSEPDIDAQHLNKIEQGILQATTAINGAVDAINAINGNLGNIKYAYYATNDVAYQGKPKEFLKTKWEELELNSIYLIRLNCGPHYLVLVQKYSYHTHGSAIISSYGITNPVYIRISNGTWTQEQLVINSDFDANNNKYLAMLKQQWKNLPVSSDASKPGYTNIETNGPTVNVLYHKHLTRNYGWAILCSYDHELPKPIYIRLVDGVWQDAFYL